MIRTTKWYKKRLLISIINEGFPGGSDGKESACNAGDPSLNADSQNHGRGAARGWDPRTGIYFISTQVVCPLL